MHNGAIRVERKVSWDQDIKIVQKHAQIVSGGRVMQRTAAVLREAERGEGRSLTFVVTKPLQAVRGAAMYWFLQRCTAPRRSAFQKSRRESGASSA